LAAGKPVISTSIRDVVRPYGQLDLVTIADSPDEFIQAAESMLEESVNQGAWLSRVDDFLADMSWDRTWQQMSDLINAAIVARRSRQASRPISRSHKQPQVQQLYK
jgi:UDP-galactopyranose mutase